MAKKVVVEGDPVTGTDTHKVTGQATNTAPPPASPTVPYAGSGRFDYVGAMTTALSDLVSIDGIAVALTTSGSTLNADEAASGKHFGPNGSEFTKPEVGEKPLTLLVITGEVGPGTPSASAGSAFVTVDGHKLLLDGDAIDTCDAENAIGNSTVQARGQSVVEVSE